MILSFNCSAQQVETIARSVESIRSFKDCEGDEELRISLSTFNQSTVEGLCLATICYEWLEQKKKDKG